MLIPNNTLINPDGSIAPFEPHQHGSRLETWQTLLNGYFEPVPIPGSSSQIALVDEEGLLKRSRDELNTTASLLLGMPILGPALIVETEDLDRD
jgi:hypothetical protein